MTIKSTFFDSDTFPVNVRSKIIGEGIVLNDQACLDDGIAGQVKRSLSADGGYTFSISVDEKSTEPWKRFILAHELGHYVLHRSLIGDGIDDNRAFFSSNDGDIPLNKNIGEEQEFEAHLFACTMLMPKHEVTSYIQKWVGKEVHVSPQDYFEVPTGVLNWWVGILVDSKNNESAQSTE